MNPGKQQIHPRAWTQSSYIRAWNNILRRVHVAQCLQLILVSIHPLSACVTCLETRHCSTTRIRLES